MWWLFGCQRLQAYQVLTGHPMSAGETNIIVCDVQIMGVWHTAIVVGGVEYYYGGAVQQAPAGCTPFGQPLDVVPLGYAVHLSILDACMGVMQLSLLHSW